MPDEEVKKIRSICVDTLTGIQSEEWMRMTKKAGHDEWADFGKDIYNFMSQLQALGFEIILVLGEPGTGKSSGMMTLEHNTNIWYNADNKNPVWTGGKDEYGKKTNPRPRYHIIPTSYDEIIEHIKLGLANGGYEDERYAFVTGHTEQFSVGTKKMERLKTLGKLATKMQIEGKMETVLYSRVEMEGSTPRFFLETQNNGYNTARSPMNLFDGRIPNDYKLVLDKLADY